MLQLESPAAAVTSLCTATMAIRARRRPLNVQTKKYEPGPQGLRQPGLRAPRCSRSTSEAVLTHGQTHTHSQAAP